MLNKNHKGAASTIILILGIILLIVVVVVFFILKTSANKKAEQQKAQQQEQQVNEPPKPSYETTLGNVKFILKSAQDLGNILIKKPATATRPAEFITTTEKYIKLVVGAQNQGKINLEKGSWDLGNIVDSNGRNFVTIDGQVSDALPKPNLCGSLLKPAFDPTDCVRFYEVSKASEGLKVEVIYKPQGGKPQKSVVDLLIQ